MAWGAEWLKWKQPKWQFWLPRHTDRRRHQIRLALSSGPSPTTRPKVQIPSTHYYRQPHQQRQQWQPRRYRISRRRQLHGWRNWCVRTEHPHLLRSQVRPLRVCYRLFQPRLHIGHVNSSNYHVSSTHRKLKRRLRQFLDFTRVLGDPGCMARYRNIPGASRTANPAWLEASCAYPITPGPWSPGFSTCPF